MLAYIRYLWYVIRHKWFVMIECWKVRLYWLGITHDISKLLPDEFFPYASHFYGRDSKKYQDERKRQGGYYKPTDTGDAAFDYAWLLHQKRNKHHWQWWILPEDEGKIKVLEMPEKYRLEMFCDWVGAGKAQGYSNNTREWYLKHKDKMQLDPKTRQWVEERLRIDSGVSEETST